VRFFLVMVVHITNLPSSYVQQANETSQASAETGVHVMVRIHSFHLHCCTQSTISQQEAGRAKVSIAFHLPAWMLCLHSGTDGGGD
jgi:hypothetical protein